MCVRVREASLQPPAGRRLHKGAHDQNFVSQIGARTWAEARACGEEESSKGDSSYSVNLAYASSLSSAMTSAPMAADLTTRSKPKRPVVLCAVQDAPVSFDLDASIDLLDDLTTQAVDQGFAAAQARWGTSLGSDDWEMVVVFPEGFPSAYPRGLDFGSPIGSRSQAGREWYRRYHESSVPVSDSDGTIMRKIREVAKSNRVTLVVGVIERCDCEITVGLGESPRETWAATEKGGDGTLYCECTI